MLYDLKNLFKTYEGRNVLDLRTLSFEENKVIGLLGPNGAGKTTLLEVLAFLLLPSSGEIWFENQKVDFSLSRMMKLRRKVVLVQQQPILFSTTVYKNVEFPLKVRKIAKNERAQIVNALLALVGMEKFGQVRADHLSGGETQRVAMARALACSPKVILLDEPMASVDIENQCIIESVIGEINQSKGMSVVFTTHDMMQASRLADDLIFLFEGKRTDSVYENIYAGNIEVNKENKKYCVIQGGINVTITSEKEGQVRISIDPSMIVINKEKGISVHNNFKGRVTQLSEEQNNIRALVDIGIQLNALVSKETFRNLNLGIGEEAWIHCPVESIKII